MPRVSIITAAYNCANSIGETIQSVKAQSYQDWEIIICDDCSTDETASTLEELSQSERIKIVSNTENLGPAGARNHALQYAEGELIVILDADDIILPTYLTQLVHAYDHAPENTGIVTCDAYIEQNGKRLPYTHKDLCPRDDPLTLDRLLQRNCIYIGSLIPKAVGESVHWFCNDIFGPEDYDFWIRILETGKKVISIDQPLAVYRESDGSVSSNIARQAINNQLVYNRALERKRLTSKQRLIAHKALYYNKAMEAVAQAWFEGKFRLILIRAPILLATVIMYPQYWSSWVGILKKSQPA